MGISDHINGSLYPPQKPSAVEYYTILAVVVGIPILIGIYIGALIWS